MSTGSGPPLLAKGFVVACVLGVPWATNAWFGMTLWVTSGKTPSEYMFSELAQVADIVRSVFDHLANPLVLQITAFWARAIPG